MKTSLDRTSWCAGITRCGSKACAGASPERAEKLGNDTVGTQAGQQLELGCARGLGALVRKVHDLALHRPVDRTMRFVYEALQIFGMPMVPARLLVVAVHALLHDRPLAVVGDEESVQIQIEAVLDRGAVDLGDEAARAGKLGAVETDAFA